MELKKVKFDGYVFDNEDETPPLLYIKNGYGISSIKIDELQSRCIEDKWEDSPYRVFYEDGFLRIRKNDIDIFTLEANHRSYDFIEYVGITLNVLSSLNVKWRKENHPEPNV